MKSLYIKLSPGEFPSRLREIPDPPKELYIEGVLPPETHKYLCVVGARKYTSYGKEVCEKLIAGLRGYPIVIVSGLALGIDGIAHNCALEAGLQTIAVPGSGLHPDVLYPASHKSLAKKIISAGGALLSEFAPNFHATVWSFPQRNRIMAGLSDAVLVIEAEEKSGTLITSKLATEYNRDVLTVPGSIFSKTSAGPHMLIRLGATPVTDSGEILHALGFATDASEKSVKDYSGCSSDEKIVLSVLIEPHFRDELISKLNMSVSEANILLSAMELKGLIIERMGEVQIA